MAAMDDYLAGLPAAELDRLRDAARRFEVTAPEAVREARSVDAWLFRAGAPPLAFLWPSDDEDTEDILFGPLIGIRCSALLICLPSGWQRIVSPVRPLRLSELEAAEGFAREFRAALLRPEGE